MVKEPRANYIINKICIWVAYRNKGAEVTFINQEEKKIINFCIWTHGLMYHDVGVYL